MLSSLNFDIREKLSAYLAGEIPLREFEDWFFPETWDVDQFDNLSLISLVYGIKLRLAEFSHGDWTEDELRSLLRPFVQQHDIDVASAPAKLQVLYSTSSISSSIRSIPSVDVSLLTPGVMNSDQYVDTQFVKVSV